jgi:hypothetical protein
MFDQFDVTVKMLEDMLGRDFIYFPESSLRLMLTVVCNLFSLVKMKIRFSSLVLSP